MNHGSFPMDWNESPVFILDCLFLATVALMNLFLVPNEYGFLSENGRDWIHFAVFG